MRLQTQDNHYHNRMTYEELIDAVEEHFNCKISETGDITYILTVTFALKKNFYLDDKGSMKPRSGRSILNHFEYCYGCLMNSKKLLGNNYERKRHLHPLTYAFVDLPHTRRHRVTGGLGQFEKMKARGHHPEHNPHIHAILAVHPDIQQNLEKLGSKGLQEFFKRFCGDVMTVDLQEITTLRHQEAKCRETGNQRIVSSDRPHDPETEYLNERGALPYASKLLKFEPDDSCWNDLYTILPDSGFRPPSRMDRRLRSDLYPGKRSAPIVTLLPDPGPGGELNTGLEGQDDKADEAAIFAGIQGTAGCPAAGSGCDA